jgi:phage shock protein PspC (stress-responsive transcriptional regulator)
MENDQDTDRPAPPPPPPPTYKRLVRRPRKGPLGGVCAGVAKYFDVDPTLVRIAAVVLAFMGPGIPAYLIAWVFVPAEDGSTIAGSMSPHAARHDRGTQVFGIVLLVIAVSILWGDWWAPARHWLIPLGLISLGGWLLVRRDDGGSGDPVPLLPPRPVDGSSPAVSPTVSTPVLDPDAPTPPDGAAPDEPGGANGDDDTEVIAEVDRRPHRRLLGPVVFGALLVWGGIAILAGIDIEAALAVALCIVGLGFVLGAFIGGSWILVFPAALIAGTLVAATIIDIPLEGGIGDKRWVPVSVDEVQDEYKLALGEATLDLRAVVVDEGDDLEVDVQVGIGHLVIYVPSGTGLEIDAEVGAGEVNLLGRTDEGPGIDTNRSIAGTDDRGTIDLDLKLGLGELEVIEVDRPAGPSLR